MPRPFGAVPFIFNTIASPINVADIDTDFAQVLTDFNDSSIGYSNWGTDTGIANAYVVTIPGPLSSYAAGMIVAFLPANTNIAGGSTVNVNTIGTITILDVTGNTPAAGEIPAGRVTYLIFDGTVFRLVNSTITGGVTYSYDYDDFIGVPKFLSNSASGGGTSQSYPTFVSGHTGLWQLSPSGGNAILNTPISKFLDTFTWTLRSVIGVNVLGVNTQFQFGMNGSPGIASANSQNKIVFLSSPAFANWQCIASNGSGTTVDSGITFSIGSFYDLKIICTASSAAFYINGSLATTISTTLPSSSAAMALTAFSVTTGTQPQMLVDTFEYLVTGFTATKFLYAPV